MCFFSSLFPQFFAEGQLSLGKAAVMLLSTLLMTFSCMLLYATAGALIQRFFRRARFRTCQNSIGATRGSHRRTLLSPGESHPGRRIHSE